MHHFNSHRQKGKKNCLKSGGRISCQSHRLANQNCSRYHLMPTSLQFVIIHRKIAVDRNSMMNRHPSSQNAKSMAGEDPKVARRMNT